MTTKDVGSEMYELCVVGAGMVGSAAAKYAARTFRSKHGSSKASVCLIGPPEPKSRHDQTIFSAHYDEARITRTTATDFVWSILAARSIEKYRDIEQESGIKFYHEVGCLTSGVPGKDQLVTVTHETMKEQNIPFTLHNRDQLSASFPYLSLSKDCVGILEIHNSGYINPRLIVKAQQHIARNNGCEIIEDIVKSIHRIDDYNDSIGDHEREVMKVKTDSGRIVYARKVLLATNAFTEGFRQLLPPGVHLNMYPVTQAVILVELSSEDLHKLRKMPSIILKSAFDSNPARQPRDPGSYDCYILPPVEYPDGKYYLKLGHGKAPEKNLTPPEIVDWYRNPVPEELCNELESIFRCVFPGLKPLSIRYDTCATVKTPSHRPFIDFLPVPSGSQTHLSSSKYSLGVAVGDCGGAAKSSDEIGRLAAEMMINEDWSDPVLKKEFFIASYTVDEKIDHKS